MKVIELTKGQVAIVDDEEFDRLAQWRWHVSSNGYAIHHKPMGGGRKIYMANEVIPPPVGHEIDHKNGNPLDNRKCNLRIATSSQQKCNRKKRTDNVTGFKGVIWNKQKEKFQSRITLNGKTKHLGFYDEAKEAHSAYCARASILHGEFARFN